MVNLQEADIVYLVKHSEKNEELRYSLRSVEKNFPHKRVVIVGYKPSWVKNVYHLNVAQDSSKRKNIIKNWHMIARDDEISEEFVIFNDDFFVVDKMDSIGPTVFGRLENHIQDLKDRNRPKEYISRLYNTKVALERIEEKDLMSFELHVPMPIVKSNLYGLLALCMKFGLSDFEVRTMYGNYFSFKPDYEQIADCKIYDVIKDPRWFHPFISTTDESFREGEVGKYIRQMFPEKSRYEV